MRVLFVTPYIPSKMRTRAYNFLRRLAAHHEVAVLGLQHTPQEADEVPRLRALGLDVEAVGHSRSRAVRNCLFALPGRAPLQVAYCHSPGLLRRASEMLAAEKFDVIHLNLIRSAYLAAHLRSYPVVLDLADSRAWYERQVFTRNGSPLGKVLAWEELHKLRRYEPWVAKHACVVLMNSDLDREELHALDPTLNVEVLHTGVDLEYFSFVEPDGQIPSLVFVGRMGYYPNERAVLWLAREVLPLVRQRHPDIRLTIVGDHPSQDVRSLASDPSINVTGYVEDIRPYLREAAAAIAPLDIATGAQLKLTEAMAAGVPIVATNVASRGVGVCHEEQLLIADDAEGFAHQVERLLADLPLRRRLAARARSCVEEKFDWERNTARLEEIYRQAIAGRLAQA